MVVELVSSGNAPLVLGLILMVSSRPSSDPGGFNISSHSCTESPIGLWAFEFEEMTDGPFSFAEFESNDLQDPLPCVTFPRKL